MIAHIWTYTFSIPVLVDIIRYGGPSQLDLTHHAHVVCLTLTRKWHVYDL